MGLAVLTVNAGSSTFKLRLLDGDDDVLAEQTIDPWDGTAQLDGLDERVLRADAVGHRVVHGGGDFVAPTVVDDGVLARIEALTPLAPLHQPRALAGIRAVGHALPAAIPTVACFDTAFHATLVAAAAMYALPAEWRRRWPLRRFGFHGLSHQYACRRGAELAGRDLDGLRVVTCHLGAGASLCASVGGRSVDTTMGFTPLEGLVMATRSGSVDPGLVLWLLGQGGLTVDAVTEGLERSSGLAGLSGTSGDMRQVMAAVAGGDEAASLAVDVYLHRLVQHVAAMAAAARGLDVLVFTGGVGEHQPAIREAAANRLPFLGVAVDRGRNAATTSDGDISLDGADVRTVVVTAREDLEIARQVRELLE